MASKKLMSLQVKRQCILGKTFPSFLKENILVNINISETNFQVLIILLISQKSSELNFFTGFTVSANGRVSYIILQTCSTKTILLRGQFQNTLQRNFLKIFVTFKYNFQYLLVKRITFYVQGSFKLQLGEKIQIQSFSQKIQRNLQV